MIGLSEAEDCALEVPQATQTLLYTGVNAAYSRELSIVVGLAHFTPGAQTARRRARTRDVRNELSFACVARALPYYSPTEFSAVAHLSSGSCCGNDRKEAAQREGKDSLALLPLAVVGVPAAVSCSHLLLVGHGVQAETGEEFSLVCRRTHLALASRRTHARASLAPFLLIPRRALLPPLLLLSSVVAFLECSSLGSLSSPSLVGVECEGEKTQERRWVDSAPDDLC